MSHEAVASKPLKTQPRIVPRRSKEEREALEREQTQRREARTKATQEEAAAEEARHRAKYGIHQRLHSLGERSQHGRDHGQLSRRGGRGGFMGEKSRATGEQELKKGSKPRAQDLRKVNEAQSAAGAAPKVAAPEGGQRSSRTGSNAQIKQETSHEIEADGDTVMAGTLRPTEHAEFGGWISSDSDEHRFGEHVNIDYIDASGDFDSDSSSSLYERKEASTNNGVRGFKPVRLKKSEHKYRLAGANAEPGVASATESKRRTTEGMDLNFESDDTAFATPAKKGKKRAHSSQASGGRVKKEREAPTGDMSTSESETLSQKARRYRMSDSNLAAHHRQFNGKSNPASQSRKTRDDFVTMEEYEEYQIHEREVKIIRRELGKARPSAFRTSKAGPENNDGPQELQRDATPPRENNVFLFQLPPILPDLTSASDDQGPSEKDIESTTAGYQSKSQPQNLRGGRGEETIKTEEDGDQDGQKSNQTMPQFPAGRVGKLRVHQSGRATLDWAGTGLELSMGVDAHFLQTAIMTRVKQEVCTEAPSLADKIRGRDGEAVSLGQIRGKFVLTPDWEELL